MRGFSLLETLVSVAILSAAVLGLTSAMLGSTHATTKMIAHQTLTDVASDVLTDLRVAAAYQPEVMDALDRTPPQPFTVTRLNAAGDAVAIRVSESLSPLTGVPGYEVTVVATAPDGHSESLQQTVIQQAVAPGSTVTQAPIVLTTPDPFTAATFAPGSPVVGVSVPAVSAAATPAASPATPDACVEDDICWPHARILTHAGNGR